MLKNFQKFGSKCVMLVLSLMGLFYFHEEQPNARFFVIIYGSIRLTVAGGKYCTTAFGKREAANYGFVERYPCCTLFI